LTAGLALALYRRYRATVYLFDVEVDKVTPRDVVNVLLRIQADGGTNIGAVMEETLKIDRPDYIYIIISDGITDAPPELTRQFISRCGARTRLILIPPSQEHYL
jgi:predicted metal-dependent peptidase